MAWEHVGSLEPTPGTIENIALGQSQRRPAAYTYANAGQPSPTGAMTTWDSATGVAGDIQINLSDGSVWQVRSGNPAVNIGTIRRHGANVRLQNSTLRDLNGNVSVGNTGHIRVVYNVSETYADVDFDILWRGVGKSAGNGPLHLKLPFDVRRWNVNEFNGHGRLWMPVGLNFPLIVETYGTDELRFWAPLNGGSSVVDLVSMAQQGRPNSGIPFNPDFAWNADNTRMSGSIRMRTNAANTLEHVQG